MTAEEAREPENRETALIAQESAKELSRLLRELPEAARARVRLDHRDIILPRQALVLLRDILAEMARGNAVTVTPIHAELTTQEAANFLNVSRPFLIKLLETGEIPFTRTGTHRRVRFQSLLEYKEQREAESEEALEKLARQAQEEDMGY